MTRTLLGLLLCCMVLTGCPARHDEEQSDGHVDARVPVTIAPVTSGSASVTIRGVGKTDALRKEKIYAPIAGIVMTLRIQEGSFVRTGETIAILRTRESQAAIAGAEVLLQTAADDRQRQEAQRALELAQRSDNVAVVKAPFDGYVAQKLVSESELVTENAELATLIDPVSIVVVAQVAMENVGAVKLGQRALVSFPSLPGRTFPARVEAVSPQATIESQTIPVRLRFIDRTAQPGAPRPTEVIAVAEIIVGERANALFVPQQAVLRNDETGQYSLFTMTPESIAVRLNVEIGVQSDSSVEIRTPRLAAGTPVIVEGNYGLADSTRVEVR